MSNVVHAGWGADVFLADDGLSASLFEQRPQEEVRSAPRPDSVPGPLGRPLSMETLPPANTRRWVVRRKAEVIAAIKGGLLTAPEACARYQLSPEELELWEESIERAGVPGLRVTRIQLYRDYPLKPMVKHQAEPKPSVSRDVFDLSRT